MAAYVVKSQTAWHEQAVDAFELLVGRASEAGLAADVPLAALAAVDRAAFGRLIEALVALGQPVSAELADLAGLAPVDEVLGLVGER